MNKTTNNQLRNIEIVNINLAPNKSINYDISKAKIEIHKGTRYAVPKYNYIENFDRTMVHGTTGKDEDCSD